MNCANIYSSRREIAENGICSTPKRTTLLPSSVDFRSDLWIADLGISQSYLLDTDSSIVDKLYEALPDKQRHMIIQAFETSPHCLPGRTTGGGGFWNGPQAIKGNSQRLTSFPQQCQGYVVKSSRSGFEYE